MNTVLWANNISDAKLIKPGMDLLILPVSGVRYTVKSGDTLAGIAKKFGGDTADIASYNGLSDDGLTEGTEIIIPGGEIKAAAKAPAKAAAKKKASGAAARTLPALSGYFGNPLPGGRLTQGIHGYNGVDIGAPSGTPIYAAAAGSVIVAKSGGYNGGYGSYVVVKHGNGTQTLYAHMSSVAASAGSVEKGALLGYVGNTGKSTGNHLHFEVRGATNPFAR
ncbi:MAG: LysM peptidoglycan-binding domain-containing protein [Legionella sp.]|nr:MAG: LysM peptidoglycan-binding domain-containing protein [Legionella sp.]